MFIIGNKIIKYLIGLFLAVLVTGILYNYFPDFFYNLKQTGIFTASLSNSQENSLYDKELVQDLDNNNIISPNVVLQDISYQDKLDNIAEQIDIIKAEVEKLLADKNNKVDKEQDQEVEQKEVKDKENELQDNEKQLDKQNIEISKPIYSKILISEVQIAGLNNDKQEFVELYNPNDIDINLTDWYLQRKTKNADSFSTYIASDLFANKIVRAKSYFIIARQGGFNLSFVDIWTDNPLTQDNSLVLKNPNKEIVDLLGWGQATDYEANLAENPPDNLSIGRKWEDNTEREYDNNFADFEIQFPTPRYQNTKYIAPIISTGGGGGIIKQEYKKILISEILLGQDEFIELYNPNNVDISLTNWYLQRKTKTAENYSSYVTKNDFEGKVILANSYFIIVRQGSQYENIANIIFDEPLTVDNSLILKNPKQEISDKLGFGQASDFETISSLAPQIQKSLGRKFIDNLEQDTDNNYVDFEIQIPTPKAQNITFVEPQIIEIPKDTTAPEVVFDLLSSLQISLNFQINFEITDLLGTVTPSGLASYIFRWNDSDPAVADNWHEDIVAEITENPISAKFIRDFVGEDQKTYHFQVKAKDNENNWSEFLPTEPIFTKIELPPPVPEPELLPIVINEIQIEGEEKAHDFVEIYNPNDVEILLDEYRLDKRAKTSSSDTTIKSWGSTDKILSKQYYLWASSTDENYPALISADISTKQNISDDNGIAIRKGVEDIGEIIDAVGWGEFDNVLFEGSTFAINPEKSKSISRTQGADTNDNSKDFIILDVPTPKAK